jgi:hypothetical protein
MAAEEGVDPIGVALCVGTAIEAGGSYFVGGSLASSLQGEPRATNDIDIVLALAIGRIDRLVAELGPAFEVDTDMLHDALLHGRSCNIFYLPVVMKGRRLSTSRSSRVAVPSPSAEPRRSC